MQRIAKGSRTLILLTPWMSAIEMNRNVQPEFVSVSASVSASVSGSVSVSEQLRLSCKLKMNLELNPNLNQNVLWPSYVCGKASWTNGAWATDWRCLKYLRREGGGGCRKNGMNKMAKKAFPNGICMPRGSSHMHIPFNPGTEGH